MDNKGSGTHLAFWLPGSAVILSLVISMFALNREPFLEPRPIGAQFQAQLPIEARLWQDPFDAVERYRKKLTDNKNPDAEHVCSPDLSPLSGDKPAPDIMVALVEGGPYADEVERRRRPVDQGAAAVADRHRRLGHCRCVELCEVLAATGIAFSTAEARVLTLTKKRRIAHDRLAGCSTPDSFSR